MTASDNLVKRVPRYVLLAFAGAALLCAVFAKWSIPGWWVTVFQSESRQSYEDWAAGRDQEHVAALALMRMAGDFGAVTGGAESGDAEAQAVLGEMLCEAGRYDEAVPWFALAAEQNHYPSMQELVVLSAPYGSRHADLATTRRWSRVINDQKVPPTFFYFVEESACVPEDGRAIAFDYIEPAFASDLPYGYGEFSVRYIEGLGVERDLVEALALTIAARRKVDSSERSYREILDNRASELEAQLSPQQIDAARARAGEWLRL